MLYRHKKTGAIVDIQSEARGDWEPVPVASSDKKEKTVKKPAKTSTKKK